TLLGRRAPRPPCVYSRLLARRGARRAARGDRPGPHRALRRGGGAPARRVRAPLARARSPSRAALEHHHVAALPARAPVLRAARRTQGARLRDLRGTAVVREGG